MYKTNEKAHQNYDAIVTHSLLLTEMRPLISLYSIFTTQTCGTSHWRTNSFFSHILIFANKAIQKETIQPKKQFILICRHLADIWANLICSLVKPLSTNLSRVWLIRCSGTEGKQMDGKVSFINFVISCFDVQPKNFARNCKIKMVNDKALLVPFFIFLSFLWHPYKNPRLKTVSHFFAHSQATYVWKAVIWIYTPLV
jgi:hypothetical protein